MPEILFKLKLGNILDLRRNRLVEYVPDRGANVRTRSEKRNLWHVW